MRPDVIFALLLATLCGWACSSSAHEADAAATDTSPCPGSPPDCAPLYGRCCEDSFFAARCEAGAWVCDTCVLDERLCGRSSRPMSGCEAFVRDAAGMNIPPAIYCGIADGG